MTTLTIENVPARVVRHLKAIAKRRNTSIEHEVRGLLEAFVTEQCTAPLCEIETSWTRQARRPSCEEIDSWINTGRQ